MTVTFTATRDQLVDAIACIELRVTQSGPMAGKVSAESMADAIIEALAAQPYADPDRQECAFRLPRHDRECSSYPEGSPS